MHEVVPPAAPGVDGALLASTRSTAHAEFAGVHDAMRHGGPLRVADRVTAAGRHPLEAHLEQYQPTQDALRSTLWRSAYGAHLPMRVEMERALVRANAGVKPPGLAVARAGGCDAHTLDTLAGRDMDMSAGDVLGDPRDDTREPADLHTAMERALGVFSA